MRAFGVRLKGALVALLILSGSAANATEPAGYWRFVGDKLWHYIPTPAEPDEQHFQVGGPLSLLYTLRYYDRNGSGQTLVDTSNISCNFDGLDLNHRMAAGTAIRVSCALEYVGQHYTSGGSGSVYVGEAPLTHPAGFKPDGTLYPFWSYATSPILNVSAANRSIGRASAAFTLPAQGRLGAMYCIRITTGIHGTAAQELCFEWQASGSQASRTPAVTPPTSGAVRPVLAGSWAGDWSNSLGERGSDALVLSEAADGQLSGTWSGSLAVSGRRVGADQLRMEARTARRDYRITGRIEGDRLVLDYQVIRLDSGGSYSGRSTLQRR